MIDPDENDLIENELARFQVSKFEAKLREILHELDECGEAVSATYVSHAIDALKKE